MRGRSKVRRMSGNENTKERKKEGETGDGEEENGRKKDEKEADG